MQTVVELSSSYLIPWDEIQCCKVSMIRLSYLGNILIYYSLYLNLELLLGCYEAECNYAVGDFFQNIE